MASGRLSVGLDYRPALFGRDGLGRYARELGAALAHIANGRLESDGAPDLRLFAWAWSGARVPSAELVETSAHVHRTRARVPSRAMPALFALARRGVDDAVGGCDVFHFTQYSALPVREAAIVATIHDCIYLTHPRFLDPRTAERMARVARELVARASRVIVPTQFVADEVVALLGAEPDGVDVVRHGCDHVLRVAPRHGAAPSGPYVLSVGRVDARKNLLVGLRAFELVAEREHELRWIVAGPPGDAAEAFARAREASKHRDRIEWRATVAEDELAALYRGARAVLFPSVAEGYGLPAIEALALGAPLVAARATCLPEVCGDAALLVDPESHEGFAAALTRVLEDEALARVLVQRGRERAREATWERAARATLDVYSRA